MQVSEIHVDGYEKVVRCKDPQSGLHALIAVHNTTLGPALGGMRMLPYTGEEEALFDVLRLSRGMTYKSAVADTGLGGGKSVIVGNPAKHKTPELFRAMGRFVDSLGGKYITAEDMNIGIEELNIVRQETRWVTGLSREGGGSGNPSPYTARGCFMGIKALLEDVYGTPSFKGRHVLLQGVGAVGGRLAELLVEAGAKVTVCDIDEQRAAALCKKIKCAAVPDATHLEVACDVYSPCARGATLNDHTIPVLKCKAIGGAANNQLLEPRHGDALRERGIVYAPDYVINAGGIINVSMELVPGGYDEARSLAKVDHIYDNVKQVLKIAREQKISTHAAADHLAELRLAAGRKARAAAL